MVFDGIFSLFRRGHAADLSEFKALFEKFQQILTGNNRALELISDLEDKLSGEYIFDVSYLKTTVQRLSEELHLIVSSLNFIADNSYQDLFLRQAAIQKELNDMIGGRAVPADDRLVIGYEDIDMDIVEAVGGKNAGLGEIRNHLSMQTPDGFVVTTTAYHRFMEHNDLWRKVRSAHRVLVANDESSAAEYDGVIDEIFDSSRIPPDVGRAISGRISALQKRYRGDPGLAVRSSAYGEDAHGQSYAGQFRSFLNCRSEQVIESYEKVIASRFKHAIAVYAGDNIIDANALPMAVGVQRTIRAASAGVLYSVDPSGDRTDCIAISASRGMGAGVVGGTVSADHFLVSRMDPSDIQGRRIAAKETELVPGGAQGLESVPVPEDLRGKASLSEAQVAELAERALLLDRYFRRPVDVEWCYDDQGELYILQCRPLKLPRKRRVRAKELSEALARAPVIMRKRGQVAQRGIAAGKVWQIGEDDDPAAFPVGAIAVAQYTTPRLTSVIRRAAAIITDVGSSSGHMATVAREFGVPAIVNTADATSLLTNGEEITVDAEENVIFKGIVTELLEYEIEAEDVFRDLREYHILRRIIRRIAPLSLIDPNSPGFTARNCRTYHDIVRFAHEKAVLRLINLNISSRRFRNIQSRRLKLPVPLGLSVIDLGGGLAAGTGPGEIDSPDRIQSVPMGAIIKGLTSPGVWSTQPAQLGLSDLVSSLTRYTMTDRVAEQQSQNVAVISDRYANINLRLGYHFNIIDTYVSDNVNDNYIYFRFVGGVTETDRRRLRAMLIKEILERLHFRASVSGDLVVARLKKREADQMVQVLEEIGRLIGFTRQLDTRMYDEESIREQFETFFGDRNRAAGGGG